VVTGRKKGIMRNKLTSAVLQCCFAIVSSLFFCMPLNAVADDSGICLSCHGTEGQFMEFANKEKLSILVRAVDLEKSVHKSLSCAACHTDISMQDHPGRKFESKKDFSQKSSRACRTCHADETLKAKPTHAFVIDLGAPSCMECHGAHKVQKISSLKASLSGNAYCLYCHRLKISKTHTNGEVLSLQIDPSNLAASVHNKHACNDCHTGFSRDSHPVVADASGREHSIAASDACGKCHGDKMSQVKGSVHYNLSFQVGDTLIKRGNMKAPVCTDCHGFHTVGPKDSYETISGAPCRKCHEDIFGIYGKSVHGMAKARGEHKAPLCSSCHFAHKVGFTAMTDKMKSVCFGCHKGAEALHEKWLPNAELHLSMIACAACHAPASGKGIYLQIFDHTSGAPISEEQVLEILGTDSATLAERLNAHGEGISTGDLSYILKQLNAKGAQAKVTFIGKMDVSKYSEAHQLAIKKNAVRECENCHSKDSKFFKNVTLAVIKADGRIAQFGAQPGVLGSLGSVATIGQFYVLGGTRLRLLDWVGILIILGGMLFPAAHIAARVATVSLRRAKKSHAHAAGTIYLHPLVVRLWHWTNAIAFLVLIFTGIQLRYYEITSLTKFKTAVTVHNVFGIVMAIGFLLWLFYYVVTGKIKLYIPPLLELKKFLTSTLSQAVYYGYGIFKGDANPHHATPDHKFNPLQQTAYFFIMFFLVPVQIITGILLLDVKRFGALIGLLGGLAVVDLVHVILSFALTAFLVVHVYLTTLGATTMQHIKAMISGYEKEE
jgi:predicted CXXCH cytochrome family protein